MPSPCTRLRGSCLPPAPRDAPPHGRLDFVSTPGLGTGRRAPVTTAHHVQVSISCSASSNASHAGPCRSRPHPACSAREQFRSGAQLPARCRRARRSPARTRTPCAAASIPSAYCAQNSASPAVRQHEFRRPAATGRPPRIDLEVMSALRASSVRRRSTTMILSPRPGLAQPLRRVEHIEPETALQRDERIHPEVQAHIRRLERLPTACQRPSRSIVTHFADWSMVIVEKNDCEPSAPARLHERKPCVRVVRRAAEAATGPGRRERRCFPSCCAISSSACASAIGSKRPSGIRFRGRSSRAGCCAFQAPAAFVQA